MYRVVLFLSLIFSYYNPQTKFAKAMFSEVFVCPQGGGSQCLSRGFSVLGEGFCPEGALSRAVSVQVSLSRETPPYGKEGAVRILLKCILVSLSGWRNRSFLLQA